MSTSKHTIFTRSKTAIAVAASLYALSGLSFAAYEARTPGAGVDDTAETDGTTAVEIPVLDNDTGVDTATLTIATAPANGTAVIQDNKIVYTPGADFGESDTFTYQVTETEWRTGVESFSLTDINAEKPVADSYTPSNGGSVTIYEGGDPAINSTDLRGVNEGFWNDQPVTDGGVVGRSFSPNKSVTSISGCNEGDTDSGAIKLMMVWNGERRGDQTDPGNNMFTITSDPAPSPDTDAGGMVLKTNKNALDDVIKNDSSTNTTAGLISAGSIPWKFDAMANWIDLTPSDFESMNITILASVFNRKLWYNWGYSFNVEVDNTKCSLNTSTVTVTVSKKTDGNGGGDGGDGGDDGGGGGGGGGFINPLMLALLSLLGLTAVLRRKTKS